MTRPLEIDHGFQVLDDGPRALAGPRARYTPPMVQPPVGLNTLRNTVFHGILALSLLQGCGWGERASTTPTPSSVSALPPLPADGLAIEAPRGATLPVRELTVALVGEVRGEIAPCGCPTLPYGGFERRERLLDRLRSTERVLHLDAGELLLKGLSTDRTEDRVARAHALLALSKQVGVDAWAPGPTDLLALGVEGLQKAKSVGPPAVSATWLKADGSALLPPAIVINKNGLRIGIVGLSSPSEAPELRGLTALDPVDAATRGVAALPTDLDLIVALGNVSDADADRVAQAGLPIAALLTVKGRAMDPPRQPGATAAAPWSNSALVVEAADRGRYLTVLRLRLGSTVDAPLRLLPGEQQWKDLRTARRQVASLMGQPRIDGAPPAPLEALQTSLAAQEAHFESTGEGRNLATTSSIPLAEDLDGPASVSATVARFQEDSVQRAVERAAQPPPAQKTGYAATSGCIGCHTPEFARWSGTDHAAAWQSLLVRSADQNAECVGCHSTGFGQPGGFGELTPGNLRQFKAVQCESCHGPLAGHPDDPRTQPEPITVQTCLRCHDEANSPQFEYATYLGRATCQGGAPDLMAPPVAPQ